MSEPHRRETGDRTAFLDRIRARTSITVPAAGPHPPPPPPAGVPPVGFRVLDGVTGDEDALMSIFTAAAHDAEARVHRGDPESVVRAVVEAHGVEHAVLSTDPEAQALRRPLEDCGVAVLDYSREAGLHADLGVTAAVAAIAVTGSVVVDSSRSGSRAVSLSPRVHLCVVPAGRLVATPAGVLRRGDQLPSARTVITGPSRTGDIEQIITLGAHGPVALEIYLAG